MKPLLTVSLSPFAISLLLSGDLFASELIVTNTANSGSGSLRGALSAAQNGDVIRFDSSLGSGPITVNNELTVNTSVTILGPDSGTVVIQSVGNDRVITVAAGVNARFSHLTIQNGNALENDSLGTNGADNPDERWAGGGIQNLGTLTLDACVITGNNTTAQHGGSGGGINNEGTLTLISTRVENNRTNDSGKGGGINNNGTLTVLNSTISGNKTNTTGGGINNNGTLYVINSTLSGNRTLYDGNGGGINNTSQLTSINSTLSNNLSTTGQGGGVYSSLSGSVIIKNTLIAGNLAGALESDLVALSAINSNGHNFLGETSGVPGTLSDKTFASTSTTLAQLLAPLADNGGPTKTHALVPKSPALNAGLNADAVDANGAPLTTDQRGFARISNDIVEIGSYESRVAIVNNTADDPSNPVCDSSACTLRGAIQAALPGDTVQVDASLVGQTITLEAALVLDKNITLIGPVTGEGPTVFDLVNGVPVQNSNLNFTTISGGGDQHIITVNTGVSAQISKFIFADAFSIASGAAMDNFGELSIDFVIFEDNQVQADEQSSFLGGAAIFNQADANLVVSNVLFLNNQVNCTNGASDCRGGALFNRGQFSATDVAFVQNDLSIVSDTANANAVGSAIYNDNFVRLSNVDFSQNEANAVASGTNAAFAQGTIYSDVNARLEVSQSAFSNNTVSADAISGLAKAQGGAFFIREGTSSLDLRNTSVSESAVKATSQNSNAIAEGGVLYALGGTVHSQNDNFSNNTVEANAISGSAKASAAALFVAQAAQVDLLRDTLSDNSSFAESTNADAIARGGAITLEGALRADTSTISTNVVRSDAINAQAFGGAIAVLSDGNLSLINSTLDDNQSIANGTSVDANAISRGGAIYLEAIATLQADTLFANSASAQLLNSSALSQGGAMYIAPSGRADIDTSLLARNEATQGANLSLFGALSISNSALSNQPDPSSASFYQDSAAQILSASYNLADDVSASAIASIFSDLKLGDLSFNGGLVETILPQKGSPLIIAGDPNYDIFSNPYDERGLGFDRKLGDNITVGPTEYACFVDSDCADDDPLTDDSCNSNHGCHRVATAAVCADDGNVCTTDAMVNDVCTHAPIAAKLTSCPAAVNVDLGDGTHAITIPSYGTITQNSCFAASLTCTTQAGTRVNPGDSVTLPTGATNVTCTINNGNGSTDSCSFVVQATLSTTPTCTTPISYFRDQDGDGIGDPTQVTVACTQPTGYVAAAAGVDNCPNTANRDQKDSNANGIGDACEALGGGGGGTDGTSSGGCNASGNGLGDSAFLLAAVSLVLVFWKRRFFAQEALLLAALSFSLVAAKVHDQGAVDALQTQSQGKVKVGNATGTVRFAKIKKPGGASKGLHLSPEQEQKKALAFLGKYARAFGLNDATAELKVQKHDHDNYGTSHITFVQNYKGVPIFGATLKVHFDRDGDISSINGVTIADIQLDVNPVYTAKRAASVALSRVGNQKGALALKVNQSRLLIYRENLARGVAGPNHLAWEIEVGDGGGIREFVYVDAHTGKFIDQITGVYDVGMSRRAFDGAQTGTVRGPNYPNTPFWVEGQPLPTGNVEADNMLSASKKTYDFFKNTFGRDSFDGNGAIMDSIFNRGARCPNASWDGGVISFCPGLTTDDITAHEWGHAYTQYTDALVYRYQSGALNESYSDIWGETIDLYNNPAPEVRSNDDCINISVPNYNRRWLLGEGSTNGSLPGPVRDMWNPNCSYHPALTSQPSYARDSRYQCDFSGNDLGGVHTNSGVPNHAYTLLVDGGTFNNVSVTGIGFVKAAAIYWRAQVAYQTELSEFADHASALQSACADLIGAKPNNFDGTLSSASVSDDDCLQVDNAIKATELDLPPPLTCIASPFNLTPPNLSCPRLVYKADFEDGLEGFTVSNSLPPALPRPEGFDQTWQLVAAPLPFLRPGAAFFAPDQNLGDCTTTDATNVTRLLSPSITLPNHGTGTQIQLTFDHSITSESGYDGGNLWIKVDDGDFQLVPKALFLFNAYNLTLIASDAATNPSTNPLAGQEAFSGSDIGTSTSEWIQSQVDLSTYAGKTIQLRFDFGTDCSAGTGAGWYVTDIKIYDATPGSFEDKGSSCGVGACARFAQMQCSTDSAPVQTCAAETPTTETANSLDDNCNGVVDDCDDHNACTFGDRFVDGVCTGTSEPANLSALSCPVNVTATISPSQSGFDASFTTPALACAQVSCDHDPSVLFLVGTTTVTCTATDATGATNTCSFSVNVTQQGCDRANPNITWWRDVDGDDVGDARDGVTTSCDQPQGFALASHGTDNCRYVANPDQKDTNNNGTGDACEITTNASGGGSGTGTPPPTTSSGCDATGRSQPNAEWLLMTSLIFVLGFLQKRRVFRYNEAWPRAKRKSSL